jgi:hypothetical protein
MKDGWGAKVIAALPEGLSAPAPVPQPVAAAVPVVAATPKFTVPVSPVKQPTPVASPVKQPTPAPPPPGTASPKSAILTPSASPVKQATPSAAVPVAAAAIQISASQQEVLNNKRGEAAVAFLHLSTMLTKAAGKTITATLDSEALKQSAKLMSLSDANLGRFIDEMVDNFAQKYVEGFDALLRLDDFAKEELNDKKITTVSFVYDEKITSLLPTSSVKGNTVEIRFGFQMLEAAVNGSAEYPNFMPYAAESLEVLETAARVQVETEYMDNHYSPLDAQFGDEGMFQMDNYDFFQSPQFKAATPTQRWTWIQDLYTKVFPFGRASAITPCAQNWMTLRRLA